MTRLGPVARHAFPQMPQLLWSLSRLTHVPPHIAPCQRRFVGGVVRQGRIGASRIGVGAHQRPDSDEVAQAGNEAPDIETFAGQHQFVSPARFSVRCRERDAVVKAP